MKQPINTTFALRMIRLLASSILAAMFLFVLPVAMRAQQADTRATDNPRVISYQGSITTNSGSPVTGDHLITTTLYSDANGTVAVWSGTYKQPITGGIFSVLLGSGAYPLPATQDFSKPLWIGVKIDVGVELKPLSRLTGAPFSFSIPDSSVTKDKMAVDYIGSIAVNGKQITGKGTALNLTDGPGTSLLYDETTNSLSFSSGGNGNLDGGKGALPQGIGTSPACQNAEPWYTHLNNVNSGSGDDKYFGSCDPQDVIMMTGAPAPNSARIQMTMIGAPVGTITGGLLIPTSVAGGQGVFFQGSAAHTYIHSFGGVTNFFAGNDAGNLALTGINNTGIGDSALARLTGGHENTAVGTGALEYNTGWSDGGYRNTAIGYWALYSNAGGGYETGEQNTACGACALLSNTIGSNNTATGWGAIEHNTTGGGNTAIGSDALNSNVGASGNSALGCQALDGNTTGNSNTGIGNKALMNYTTGSFNTATGACALAGNTDLNPFDPPPTDPSTGSFNTGDGDSTLFRNTTGSYNTASGSSALFSNTTGTDNTASGYQALYSNTTGADNTASGEDALYSNTADGNTADGYFALGNNTTGTNNTASGGQALSSNTTGDDNTANGWGALVENNGYGNTASGFNVLFSNTSGSENTAIGDIALETNMTGIGNTACGSNALVDNSAGNYNTASGMEALFNTTGSNNTAIGYLAGQANTSGSNNTFVGYLADASSAALTNASAFGNGAVVGASNTIELGNMNVTNVSTSGSLSITSAGQGLQIKGGANAKIGIATLAAGTVTVSTTAVTANSVIFLTEQPTVSSPGAVYVSTITAGTSFVITSTTGTDASRVAWMIVEKN